MATMLLVDTDRMVQSALKRLLASMDVRVEVALTAEEASSRMSIGAAPDVVLAENELPGQSGYELLCGLPARLPYVERILYTADDEFAAMLIEAPFPILVKPAQPSRLKACVAMALARRSQALPRG